MKITKEYLRKLIKEELASLEQEGYGDGSKSYHYGDPGLSRGSSRKIKVSVANPEQEFKFGMANLFQSLTRPIYSDGQAVVPDDASISRGVEEFAKKHAKFTEQFMTAAKTAVKNIRSTVQEQFAGPEASFKEMPEVVEAFDQTADKFLKKISQVSGKTGTGGLPPSMNESSKVKISFTKK